MALFLIDAVKFNAKGDRVEQVRWGKVKGGEVGPPVWAAEPSVVDVKMVIDAIDAGDEVLTIFHIGGEIVMGPQVQVVIYDHGVEGIELTNQETPSQTLQDLPKI